MDIVNQKYKDMHPNNTLKIIQSILDKNNINIDVKNITSTVSNIYSVHVNIDKSKLLFSNGKGTSLDYAIASAYAESIERLQNQFIGKNFKFDKYVEKYLDFTYSLDEKNLNIKEVIVLLEEIYDFDREFFKSVIKSIYNENQLILSVPFYNINKGNLINIPIDSQDFLYGSNGMCAGNTIEEALVQGISEVIERYVSREIIENNIVPPTIEKKQLLCNEQLLESINFIESKGIQLIFKDCSLSKGLPALGLIAIDKLNKSYIVKFAAHPCIDIVVERLITEFMQGKNIFNFKGMVSIHKSSYINETKNKLSIFENSTGYYSDEFFSNKFSYEYNNLHNFYHNDSKSNKQLLEFLVNMIKTLGYEILIRDVSFLGFNSYRIIIPGFSEIFNSEEDLKYYIQYKKIKQFLIKIPLLDLEEIYSIYNFFMSNIDNFEVNYNMYNMLEIPINEKVKYTNINYFLSMLSLKLNKNKNSILYMEKFIYTVDTDDKEKEVLKCFCLIKKLEDKIYDYAIKRDILLKFYDLNIIEQAEIINCESYFKKYFNFTNCWECNMCENTFCDYDILKSLKLKIKDSIKNNVVEQIDLRNQLSYLLLIGGC